MFMEGAAQSSVGFSEESSIKMGFISMVKELRVMSEIEEKRYRFKLKREAEMNAYRQYSFEAFGYENNLLTVRGRFTLVLQK